MRNLRIRIPNTAFDIVERRQPLIPLLLNSHPRVPLLLTSDIHMFLYNWQSDFSHPLVPLLLMSDVSHSWFLCYWCATSAIFLFLSIDERRQRSTYPFAIDERRQPFTYSFAIGERRHPSTYSFAIVERRQQSAYSFAIDERRQRSTGSFAIDKRHTAIHKILVFFVRLFPLNHVFFHCLFCIFFRFGWKNIFLLFAPCFSSEKSIFCPVFSAALCEIIKCFILICDVYMYDYILHKKQKTLFFTQIFFFAVLKLLQGIIFVHACCPEKFFAH